MLLMTRTWYFDFELVSALSYSSLESRDRSMCGSSYDVFAVLCVGLGLCHGILVGSHQE